MNRYSYISKPDVAKEKLWAGLTMHLNQLGFQYNQKVSKMTPEEQEKNGLPTKIKLGSRRETYIPILWRVYNATGGYNMEISEFEIRNYYEPI